MNMWYRVKKRALKSFTDSLYLINFRMVMTVVFVSLGMVFLSAWLGFDSTALTTVCKSTIVCAFAELGTHTAFVIYKAKAENMAKYKQVVVDESVTNNSTQNMVGQMLEDISISEDSVG